MSDQKTELTSSIPEGSDHRNLKPDGQQQAYVVLTEEERAKGFVRPVRYQYTHKTCGTDTRMDERIAQTYARDPGFYSGTFCVHCRVHRPLSEFVWNGTNIQVGT